MATSRATRPLCKVCNKTPGVFLCPGCQKEFCPVHSKEHRQELSKQLDTIILEHDQLKQDLAEYSQKSTNHPLMQQIYQWEKDSLNKIRRAADDARKQLAQLIGDHTNNIATDLTTLTQELTTARSEDSFIEIDLNDWTDRLVKCTKDLLTPSSISVQQETSNTPFIQRIVVSLEKNEFFEHATEKMKIADNGQVIKAVADGYSTARGHGQYSSGQHKLRFQIEVEHTSNWILFGIVSKNTPLQETSHNTPTTFGWITNNFVVRSAVLEEEYNGYQCDIALNDTVELFLDCDCHKIRLTNERTNKRHELDVDLTKCPFPWQFHFGLYYHNDRIRILSS